MYDDFFAKAHELVQAGEAFVTAVVVRSEKPTSGKPGDKAIITADGVMFGWIGGSCAQPTVLKEALNALRADEVRQIRLFTEPEAQTAREGLLDLPLTQGITEKELLPLKSPAGLDIQARRGDEIALSIMAEIV